MTRRNISDLLAFRAVAQERSFTRAAAYLGVSPSALSHAVRGLEDRIGVRLLTRTTRSVAPTHAGDRLLATIAPRFDEIEAELAAIGEMRDRPAGTIRVTTGIHAAETILWPVLAKFLPNYPDVTVEISVDNGLIDIAAKQFDAGIRMGETIEQDMIAVPIGPDLRMAAVGAPAYFNGRTRPETPQDLAQHDCINLRFPTFGGLYAWEFDKDGRALNIHVDGQVIVNEIAIARQAAIDGCGITYLPEDYVEAEIESGRLERVLGDWCPPFSGYHLYYPSRHQHSQAFSLFVEALRVHR